MNKQELIDAVATSTGESKASTGSAIDAILEAVTAAAFRLNRGPQHQHAPRSQG